MKVPLDSRWDKHIPPEQRFTPQMALEMAHYQLVSRQEHVQVSNLVVQLGAGQLLVCQGR